MPIIGLPYAEWSPNGCATNRSSTPGIDNLLSYDSTSSTMPYTIQLTFEIGQCRIAQAIPRTVISSQNRSSRQGRTPGVTIKKHPLIFSCAHIEPDPRHDPLLANLRSSRWLISQAAAGVGDALVFASEL